MEQPKNPVFDRLDALRQEIDVIQTTLASNTRVLELEAVVARELAKNRRLANKLDRISDVLIRILNEDDDGAEPAVEVVMGVSLDDDDNEEALIDEEEVEKETVKCIPCGKEFTAPRYLKRHNNKMHRSVSKTESSSDDEEERLVVRNYTIRADQTFACTKCNRSYKVLSSLKRHKHMRHR
jgi:hypothetical protein